MNNIKKYKKTIIFLSMLSVILLFRCGIPLQDTLLIKYYSESNGSGGDGSGAGNGGGGATISRLCVDDSIITQVLSSTGILYIGGDFTQVGTCAGGGTMLNVSDGSPKVSFNSVDFPIVNGPVYASVADANGGFYIGGSFSIVKGQVRNNIAHIDGNGLLTDFSPNLDGEVRTLALKSDGSILYIGGGFTKVGGVTTGYAAAVTVADGNLHAAFDPDVSGTVYSIALSSDDSIMFLGGAFSDVNGYPRQAIAGIYTVDGSLIPYGIPRPWASSIVYSVVLSSDDSTCYFAGQFTSVQPPAATPRNRVAALDIPSGQIDATFNPNANDIVFAIALSSDDSKLYLGGQFTNVGGQARNRIAVVDTTNGNALGGFDPNANDTVYSLALSSDDSKIYIGGAFTTLDGGATLRTYSAALNTVDGSAISGFDPSPSEKVESLSLSNNNSTIYMGGDFELFGGTIRNRVAAIDTADGTLVTGFDANVGARVDELILTDDDSKLYIGGRFTSVGGQTRNYVAAVNALNGALDTNFDPNTNGNVYTLVFNSTETNLYMGGAFTVVGGQGRDYIAEVDPTTGAVRNFNPEPNNAVYDLELSSDDSILYIAGLFYRIYNTPGIASRKGIGAVYTSNWNIVAAFDPWARFSNGSNAYVFNIALTSDDSIIYAGGQFDKLDGVARSNIAAVDTVTGTVIPTFDPSANDIVYVFRLNADESKLYFAGSFTQVGGVDKNYIAAVSTVNGSLDTNFNPNVDNGVAFLLYNADKSIMYMVGSFKTIGSTVRHNIGRVNPTDGSFVEY